MKQNLRKVDRDFKKMSLNDLSGSDDSNETMYTINVVLTN